MACSTLQNDKSLERRERWKRHFLKTSGMFYFAERQELRAPRKTETSLSEAQWHVRFFRTQRATPRKMETPLSEAQRQCSIFHNDRCPTRNAHFRLSNKISDVWSEGVFLRSDAKTPFPIGDEGAMLLPIFHNDRSLTRNAHFRLSSRISDFWSEGVFVRSPTRKHHFRLCTPLGPL